MTVRNFNNVTTVGTLTGPVASSATTLGVQNFSGNPSVPFTITMDRNTATEEICLVTAVAGGTLTVTRGYDGSAAQAHAAGGTVEHTAGAIEYAEANAHVNATTDVHGVAGALVGTDGAQSLFAKTLVSPVVQADATAGDAVVAWVPPDAPTRNLFRGMNTAGADVITVDAAGNANVHNVHATGTAIVDGVTTLAGGATVPAGKKVTLTDAPASGTDAANKTYVDGKTWPSTAISDAASAATASKVMARDANGRAQVADPAVAADIANKKYVDSHVITLGDTGFVALTLPGPFFGPTAFPTGYRIVGGTCTLQLGINGGDPSTDGAVVTLPAQARPAQDVYFTGENSGAPVAELNIAASTGVVTVLHRLGSAAVVLATVTYVVNP